MQKAMKEVNEKNVAEGLPVVEMGIGVNTGDVIVGNIGSLRRTKYGAVGPNMNLTARIESVTVGGQILISDSTLEELGGDANVGESFDIRAKGFVEPIRVHELLGVRGTTELSVTQRELELVKLDRAVPVDFAEFEGKQIGRAFQEAELVGISARGSELSSRVAVTPKKNIKLTLLDPSRRIVSAEVYGKVQAVQCQGKQYCTKVRFTSAQLEADRFMNAIMARSRLHSSP
jgi:adenylate cyclase